MTHRALGIVIMAATPWSVDVCRCQTVTTNGFDWVTLSPTTVTARPPVRIAFDKFVDPLITNTPAQTLLPSGMTTAEALQRRAEAQGRVEALNASAHSNVGILSGDIRQAERVIDPKYYPEWAMRRWEALRDRLFPTNSVLAVTNSP